MWLFCPIWGLISAVYLHIMCIGYGEFPAGTELAWCLTEAVPEMCPCGLLQGILSRAWRMLVTQSATRCASCNKTWNTSMYRELPQILNVQAGQFLLTAVLTVSRIQQARIRNDL